MDASSKGFNKATCKYAKAIFGAALLKEEQDPTEIVTSSSPGSSRIPPLSLTSPVTTPGKKKHNEKRPRLFRKDPCFGLEIIHLSWLPVVSDDLDPFARKRLLYSRVN